MARLKNPWDVVARGTEPVGEVAARVLVARLETIPGLLRAAAAGGDDDEAIHALRVGTRRCRAALDAFEDLFHGRDRRWIATRLKRLRRVAGAARDLDVLTARLAGDQGVPGTEPTVAAIANRNGAVAASILCRAIPMLDEKKRQARQPIRAAWRAFAEPAWRARVWRLADGIGGRRAEGRFAAVAARRLATLSRRFLEAAEECPGDGKTLHALRIRAKKTRYELEIFGGAMEAGRRKELVAGFTRLQDLAGMSTDHAYAARQFARLAKRAAVAADRTALAACARTEARMAEHRREKFLAWMTRRRVKELARAMARRSRG
jgi:CHAD domain-containing protein